MQGLSQGVIRVDSEERLSVLTVQDVGTVMPGGTHMYMHDWFWESLKCGFVYIVVRLVLMQIKGKNCVMYDSLCVLYLLLHKVRNAFIDVVYVQLWCVWSNQREFLSCAEQMRLESCVVFHRHGNVILWALRAWQKNTFEVCVLSERDWFGCKLGGFSYPESPDLCSNRC